tara:strand:- start:376 stop:2682 length:2307 start_codon:yes stop_codon:yes gene_type:complete
MQELILYIKPQLRDNIEQDYVKVDLFNDEIVSLTQVIQDIRDIDKVFTDFSKTFSVPASSTNNKLFKHWYNPNIDGFDANLQSDAKIELNYQPFREGKIKLQEVTMKDNRPNVYKITFFGNTVSLNNLFGEDKLNNLVWLDNFSFENSSANILNGLQNGLDFTVDSILYNEAVILPLITHSQRYIYDSTSNLTDAGNLSISATNNTQRGVLPEDLKPAIKLSIIIKAIEEQYSIDFKTGNFFETLPFTSLYMWLNRDKGKIETKNSLIVDATTFTCVSVGGSWRYLPTQTLCNVYSNFPTEFIDGVYKVTKNDYILQGTPPIPIFNSFFSFAVEVTPNTGFTTVPYNILIYDALNGEQLSFSAEVGVGTNSVVVDTVDNPMVNGESKNITCEVISSTNFEFGININVGQSAILDGQNTLVEYAEFNSTSTAIPVTVQEIRSTIQIPDMKVIDFLKGLFKTFNLTAFIDNNNKIIVKTLNDFYDDSTTEHNLTKYVDKNKNIVGEALPFSSIKFDYPEPKSKLAIAFSNINNVEYGELNYIANASESNAYNVASPFEHMLFERLPDLATGINTEVQYGFFVDSDDNPITSPPLIFYGIRNTNISPEINYVDTVRPTAGGLSPVGTRTTISNYWMPHNASSLGTKALAPEYNLNFGSEINSYTLRDYGGNNNSLFQLYYRDYIQRVFNTKTRIFKYSAILPLNFLLTYSLADTIIISDRLFTINKITTNLQTGQSTLELLNEAPRAEADNKEMESGVYKTTESGDTKTIE